MELWLIRHALAVDGDDDDARELSEKGQRRLRDVARGLDALGARFDLLLHSPKVRAAQTAHGLRHLAAHVAATALLSRAPDAALLRRLDEPCVALVGHQPHLTALAAWLCFGDPALGARLELKKCGALVLSGAPEPGCMTLTRALPPGLLRRRWR
jgi:phosphohistidine phosphatase